MIMKDSKMHKKRLNKIHRWVEKEGNWLHKSLSDFLLLASTNNYEFSIN